MSVPQTNGGYALGPGEGEALWFNGGLGVLKATGDQTEGHFAALEEPDALVEDVRTFFRGLR